MNPVSNLESHRFRIPVRAEHQSATQSYADEIARTWELNDGEELIGSDSFDNAFSFDERHSIRILHTPAISPEHSATRPTRNDVVRIRGEVGAGLVEYARAGQPFGRVALLLVLLDPPSRRRRRAQRRRAFEPRRFLPWRLLRDSSRRLVGWVRRCSFCRIRSS